MPQKLKHQPAPCALCRHSSPIPGNPRGKRCQDPDKTPARSIHRRRGLRASSGCESGPEALPVLELLH